MGNGRIRVGCRAIKVRRILKKTRHSTDTRHQHKDKTIFPMTLKKACFDSRCQRCMILGLGLGFRLRVKVGVKVRVRVRARVRVRELGLG